MSYILDALRKSEKERRRASIPDPFAVQEPIPSEKKTRSPRSYLILVTLLLSTLILGLWFGLWYAKKTPAPGEEANQAAYQPQVNASQNGGFEIKNMQQLTLEKDMPRTEKSSPDILNSQDRRKSRENPVRQVEGRDYDSAKTSPVNTHSEAETEKEIPPPDKNKLYGLSELPLSVRQKLPDFSLSVFLYTDEPASRMVRVNGLMMKEGQYLSSGLKLEEIIPEGLIFSYLNYRFRVGIP